MTLLKSPSKIDGNLMSLAVRVGMKEPGAEVQRRGARTALNTGERNWPIPAISGDQLAGDDMSAGAGSLGGCQAVISNPFTEGLMRCGVGSPPPGPPGLPSGQSHLHKTTHLSPKPSRSHKSSPFTSHSGRPAALVPADSMPCSGAVEVFSPREGMHSSALRPLLFFSHKLSADFSAASGLAPAETLGPQARLCSLGSLSSNCSSSLEALLSATRPLPSTLPRVPERSHAGSAVGPMLSLEALTAGISRSTLSKLSALSGISEQEHSRSSDHPAMPLKVPALAEAIPPQYDIAWSKCSLNQGMAHALAEATSWQHDNFLFSHSRTKRSLWGPPEGDRGIVGKTSPDSSQVENHPASKRAKRACSREVPKSRASPGSQKRVRCEMGMDAVSLASLTCSPMTHSRPIGEGQTTPTSTDDSPGHAASPATGRRAGYMCCQPQMPCAGSFCGPQGPPSNHQREPCIAVELTLGTVAPLHSRESPQPGSVLPWGILGNIPRRGLEVQSAAGTEQLSARAYSPFPGASVPHEGTAHELHATLRFDANESAGGAGATSPPARNVRWPMLFGVQLIPG